MNREEYRTIKNLSKDEMDIWLRNRDAIISNKLRKEYNQAYKEELDNSVQNFIFAIAYTLRFNEDLDLDNDKVNSFMEDLFVTVDMFRKGEYTPEDYSTELKQIGVSFAPYDYTKIYREKEAQLRLQLQSELNSNNN